MKKKYIIISIFFLSQITNAQTTIPAFPGAEGFGAKSIGGRGGKVIEVTNLNNSGAGSFRAACEASGPRIVVFKVAGLISLTSRINIQNPYITIAGQTAPGDGICIRGGQLSVNTHNIVVRYIRSRAGDNTDYNSGINPDNRDCFEIQNQSTPPYNVIFDHCSASWGIDETMSTWYPCKDITIQWCILAEGLQNSLHTKGPHGKGLLIGDGARGVSILNTVFANNFDRNPMIKASTTVEFNNNIVYGWGSDDYNSVYVGLLGNEGHTPLQPNYLNIIGNTFLPSASSFITYSVRANSDMDANSKIFIKDNIGLGRMNTSDPEVNILRSRDRGYTTSSSAVSGTTYEPVSRTKAYDLVLAGAGAILPKRDAVDTRVINDIKNGTGKIINSQSEVGGYPVYTSGTPYLDTDKDGMSNDWETKYGFNPNDASDGSLDADKDGYTNVEEFLNNTIPKESITEFSEESDVIITSISLNANTNELHISNAPIGSELSILSLDGKVFKSEKINSEQHTMQISEFYQGFYLVKIGSIVKKIHIQ